MAKNVRTIFKVRSFNLRQLTYSRFSALSDIAAIEVHEDHQDLRKARKIGNSRKGKLAVISYVCKQSASEPAPRGSLYRRVRCSAESRGAVHARCCARLFSR
jgi:hypothetical protein